MIYIILLLVVILIIVAGVQALKLAVLEDLQDEDYEALRTAINKNADQSNLEARNLYQWQKETDEEILEIVEIIKTMNTNNKKDAKKKSVKSA